ncbi:uncharacterized protein LOC105923916 isoform X2 [Fundulus heteroclitus]|uniref:uncharacterized protein LOC105923916 isoform X2 n=1 Tax=Fundulus heteroclitus TaxID=8078 RepID=UPI00165C4CA3|nr:uncharacterized protein LOC105923916 isoform X2 [Fundulus heteroclitus]
MLSFILANHKQLFILYKSSVYLCTQNTDRLTSEMKPLYIIVLLLCKICKVLNGIKTSDIIQETGIRTAKVGETVTLRCSCQHNSVSYLLWYQQSLERKPHIVSKRMKHSTETTIYPAYKKRFQVVARPEEGVNDLIVTDLQPLDSGMYYCVILAFNAIEFGQGIFLHVKTSSSNTQLSIHQPPLKLLHLGDSVNLSCSVSAERCEGEQRLYWFRRTASQPALMYPSEIRCAGTSNGTLYGINCTSYLELNMARSSDAGTYHCTLASCGVVVFGEGTKVEIAVPRLLVYCLSAALALFIFGLLFLSFLRSKIKSKLCSSCKGTHLICSEASNTAENQAESLHYAALNLKRRDNRQRQEDIENVCVYSGVRSRK